jgi:polyphosphate kinase
MAEYTFFDRDLSWLTFNGRILELAAQDEVPLIESVSTSWPSSPQTLDEFYRVRMPVLQAMDKLGELNFTPTSAVLMTRWINCSTSSSWSSNNRSLAKLFSGQIIPQLKRKQYPSVTHQPTYPGCVN